MKGNVQIDDKFARFGSKSYAINKINSVDVRSHRPHGEAVVYVAGLLALIFVLAAVGSMSDPNGSPGVLSGACRVLWLLGLLGLAAK